MLTHETRHALETSTAYDDILARPAMALGETGPAGDPAGSAEFACMLGPLPSHERYDSYFDVLMRTRPVRRRFPCRAAILRIR